MLVCVGEGGAGPIILGLRVFDCGIVVGFVGSLEFRMGILDFTECTRTLMPRCLTVGSLLGLLDVRRGILDFAECTRTLMPGST